MTEKCEQCCKETKCNFGMHGRDLRLFFCSADHMVEYAKNNGYEPFSGMVNV